ncbi:HAMP domain-containing sensor histidine kinase [Carnobacterium sp.]|uniref:sensor histidine kinase n=1 Tax=Carnobacterium sp. TaxID=48221 RepID=UPI0028AAEC49|nr:HAMP domain-containing sensor histidine kinase [Carnobacterium sp.]
MIEKLRKKFMLVMMASVFVVMLLVLGTLNVTNILHTNERADDILSVLAENGGNFPQEALPEEQPLPVDGKPGQAVTAETPYETRFFKVIANKQRQVIQVDTSRIRSVDSEEGKEYAESILSTDKEKGYVDDFRYRVEEQDDDSYLLLFMDSQRELQTVRLFLWNSFLIGSISLILIFLLVFYFSKKIVRPAQQSMDKQKRFITDAGHEIKTPLAIISANNEVQEMLNGQSEWTESTGKQIQRLTGLMENMLQLAQMEEPSYQQKIETINLSQVLQEICEPYVMIGKQKKVAVTLDIQSDVFVRADALSLNKLCSILMDNANKYVQDLGTIHVQLSVDRHKAKLRISNTTKEMPRNFDQLFDRFYREDQSRQQTADSYGIGLSMASAIVEKNNGQITANQLDDQTIVFDVVLPLQ